MKTVKIGTLGQAKVGTTQETELMKRFKTICSNTRKFNGRNMTYKTKTLSNGKQFQAYYNGEVYRTISILTNADTVELGYQDFKVF